jgi:protein kinase-like protein
VRLSAARLRHPGVVTVYTADEADGLLYLAMEYVPGQDLAALIDRVGRLPADWVAALLARVADALDAAHRAQLVHRDVKPSNLVIGPDGQVTLLDFGISRMLDDDSEITRTGEIVGTIAYCSPEQLSRGAVEGACDQYSLACVAYECLTGSVPFPREGKLAMMTAHLTAPPPRVSAPAGVPAGLDAVLARALAKDPAARYPTCTDFASAFAAVLAAGGSRDDPRLPEPAALAPAPVAPGDPTFLTLRVGWAGIPMAVDLAAGPLAVRGEPGAATGLVRWLLAQAVARHAVRDLTLACVLVPEPDENWLWVNWLPHARPTRPPLTGPHVATTAEAAADLLARLGTVVAQRAGRVLAVIDARLGAMDLTGLAEVARAGVPVVALLGPGTPAPYGMSTLDIAGDRARLVAAGAPPVEGELETVSAGFVRDLAENLPDA